MSNISGSINLAAFEKSFYKTLKAQDGTQVECICVPLVQNHLAKTAKGACYVNWQGREYINEEFKTTHIVSQSLPKEAYEAKKEKGEYAPTLGNATDWAKLTGSGGAQITQSDIAPPEGEDDLPF